MTIAVDKSWVTRLGAKRKFDGVQYRSFTPLVVREPRKIR